MQEGLMLAQDKRHIVQVRVVGPPIRTPAITPNHDHCHWPANYRTHLVVKSSDRYIC